MAFSGAKQLAQRHLEGGVRYTGFRKAPSQTTVSRVWFDLVQSPGLPKPFYYASAPLEAAQMKQSEQGGLYHGADVSPKTKHLRTLLVSASASTALPMPLILCDYLLYYPFFDTSDPSEQLCTNTQSLPRYSDGAGVRMFAVLVAPGTGGQTFQVKYTNQDGVTGRLSEVTTITNSALVNGTIVNSQASPTATIFSPFIALQQGDTGVRAIESIIMISGTDVALLTFVLVKPLATINLIEQTAASETDFLINLGGDMPRIYDDAYLNFICCPGGTLAATGIMGEAVFAFN